HEAQTLARVAGVERQIGAAGLEDGDERNHQLQRALQAHPHHPLRTNPKRAQLMRQLVGATLELPVAELLIPKHDRNRVRRRSRLRRKQLAEGPHPPAPAPPRSNLAGSYGAPPPTESPADQSLPRAPQPLPPADEQAAPPEPQRFPARTGRVDSRAAAAAARSAPPSGSEDSASHRARSRCKAADPPQHPTGRHARQGSSQTPPSCRIAPPLRPAAGSRPAQDAGAQSVATGCPAPL